ncbi:MAG: hypothetical protein QW400_04075 [Candidatus Diapherotrites archaeon]
MKKWKKLVLIAIPTFIIFLLLFLWSTGFFKLFEPPLKEGEYYRASPETFGRFKLTIKDSSLTPNEIPVPIGQIVGVVVANETNTTHRVLFFKKKGDDVNAVKEYFLKPGEEKLIYGFYFDVSKPDMPEKIKQEEFHTVMDKSFVILYEAVKCKAGEECFVGCTTCYGHSVQSKVVMSKQ